MEDKIPNEKEKETGNYPQYFWNFRGYSFVQTSEGKIYEPIADRPDSQSDSKGDLALLPVTVKIKRDTFDIAIALTGWLISLATLSVVAIYTYYAGGQWVEMQKATKA